MKNVPKTSIRGAKAKFCDRIGNFGYNVSARQKFPLACGGAVWQKFYSSFFIWNFGPFMTSVSSAMKLYPITLAVFPYWAFYRPAILSAVQKWKIRTIARNNMCFDWFQTVTALFRGSFVRLRFLQILYVWGCSIAGDFDIQWWGLCYDNSTGCPIDSLAPNITSNSWVPYLHAVSPAILLKTDFDISWKLLCCFVGVFENPKSKKEICDPSIRYFVRRGGWISHWGRRIFARRS